MRIGKRNLVAEDDVSCENFSLLKNTFCGTESFSRGVIRLKSQEILSSGVVNISYPYCSFFVGKVVCLVMVVPAEIDDYP